jgi:ApaLI-like restriction endonuclease.
MNLYSEIKDLALKQIRCMNHRMAERILEMRQEDKTHHLMFNVLGYTDEQATKIEEQEQRARFLYANAGKFADKSVKLCFTKTHDDAKTIKIPNPNGPRPKTFEIDIALPNGDGIEVKWRDATTDGDHRNKEQNRVRAIADAGFKPIRVMLFLPNRDKAIKAQAHLKEIYREVGGSYLSGADGFDFIRERTKIDYLSILKEIAADDIIKSAIEGQGLI